MKLFDAPPVKMIATACAALALVLLPSDVAAAMSLTVSVPEPATTMLVATGLAGMAVEIRRRRNKK